MAAVAGSGAVTFPKWSDEEYAAPPGELVTLPTPPGIPYCTPLEIASSTSERPEWLTRGYAALGAITEIDGKIKSSGKTTFATHWIATILDGQPFLGQPTMTTKVVYLTEQTPGPFREALARANLLGRGSELRVVFRADVSGMPWAPASPSRTVCRPWCLLRPSPSPASSTAS